MAVQVYKKEIHIEIREQSWCQNAQLVQSACNIAGVVRSLREMLVEMTELGFDEKAKRQHPATVLFLNKLTDMIDCPMHTSEFMWKCFEECRKRGGVVEI